MTLMLRFVAGLFAAGFLLMIFELVRRRRLKENYSLTWFFVGGCVMAFALFGDQMDALSHFLGFAQTSNAILVFSVFLILVLLLGLSVAVSRLSGLVQTMAQEIGILKNQLEEERNRSGRLRG